MDESEKAELIMEIQDAALELIEDGGYTKDDIVRIIENL